MSELQFAVFGTVAFRSPPVPLPIVPPPGGTIVAASPPTDFSAALNIEEWSLAAKFSTDLVSKLSANWLLGVTRAQFESEGSFTFNELISVNPTVINTVSRPYASPDNETGLIWGIGFAWQTTDRLSLDLGYRKHETQVVDVETTSLRALFTF